MSTSAGPISRRSLLRLFSVGTGMAILAACGGSAQPSTSPAPPSQGPASSPAAAAPSSAAASAAAKPSTAASVSVSAPASSAAAAVSPSVQPKLGGTLQAIQAGDLASVDGHYYTPGAGLSAWIVFDTLTAYDDNLKPQPALAESWDQSTDLKTIKLNLRKGVTFHNGRELTSDDVIYNLNRILDVKITVGIITGFIQPGTTWTNPDKYTVMIQTPQPWIVAFDFFQIFNILDKDTAEGPDAKSKAVGTGPFTLQEWVVGQHVNYGKNKNWWQSGKPYLDGIVLNIAKDQQSMTAQFEGGQAQFMVNPTLQDYARLQKAGNYQALTLPNPAAFWMFQPNVTRKPLDDKRVRQALNFAIDRQRMVDSVLLGTTKAQDLPWPDASPAAEPAKNSAFAFNLDKAKALLDQAGQNNWELDLLVSATSAEGNAMLQIYQSDLAKIGVKGTIRQLATAALLDAWHTQTYGLYVASDPWANLEPVTQYVAGSTTGYQKNNAGYTDPQYTQLVSAAAGEPDATKRKALYSQLNDFFLDASFDMPLASRYTYGMAVKNLQGLGHRRNEMWTFYNAFLS